MNFERRGQYLHKFQEAERLSADSALETFGVDSRKKAHVSESIDGSIKQQNDPLKNTVKLIQAIKAIQDMKLLVEESSSEVEAILRQEEMPGEEYKEYILDMEKEYQHVKENEAKMSDLNDHLRTENEILTKTNKQVKEQLAILNKCVDDERAKSIQRKGLLKSDHAKLTHAYIFLKDQLQNKQLQYDTLLEEKHRISRELFDCKTRWEIDIKKVVQERDRALAESKERSLELKKEKGEITEQLNLLQQSKNDTDKLANEYKQIQDELVRKKVQYNKLQEHNNKVTADLDYYRTRLSKLMESKLSSDNSPNIADLSDRNRPTKIAEMYEELYDYEWTDAYEVFDGYFKDEKSAVKYLKSVLEHVKGFCDYLFKDQTTRLVESLTMKTAQSGQLSHNIIRQLKDMRKSLAESSLDGVLEKYIKHVEESQASGTKLVLDERVRPFIKGCVKICWFMSVQDPPLEFGTDPDSTKPIDTNVYKFYTKIGTYVDYVVLPPLYLHKEGPVLAKGILQGQTLEEKRYITIKGETTVAKRDATVVRSYTPQENKSLERERKGCLLIIEE